MRKNSAFEYCDEWKFMGSWETQDPGNKYNWKPTGCFDTYADEDYWGITKSVYDGQAVFRVLKLGYWTLREEYAKPIF